MDWIAVLAGMGVLAIVLLLWWGIAGRRAAHRREVQLTAALHLLAQHNFLAARKQALDLQVPYEDPPLSQAVLHLTQTTESEINELTRARQQLEDVLGALQDAVLVVDRNSRLRYLNPAAVAFFNFRVEDVLGALIVEVLPSFSVEAEIRSVLADGHSVEREMALYGPRMREVLLRVWPMRRPDGTMLGAVAIVQDLTELRRLERVRRDFVANASHELRTPIANIRAVAETLGDVPGDAELAARFLPRLVSEAERLSRLISDLLILASAESAPESPESACDLVQVVQDVMARLGRQAEAQQVALAYSGEQSARVRLDVSAVDQIVVNLLDNAIAYSPPPGSVQLAVHTNTDSGRVELQVSDSGIGIPPDDLNRIFERFYRVDKARSRAQGGTGLGLAIIKHIVEQHDGQVLVESELGRGSTFRVLLPSAISADAN